ncbi:MAG: type II secretion system protein [Sulfuricurvum sp.]|nr:type II secretion system protein [Sulfuricurvum sp.]
MPLMKTSHKGMTLFELLIVVTIIGIVYSVGLFTMKKEKINTAIMNISTLKTTLLALSPSSEIRLHCDVACHDCSVISEGDKVLTTLHLQSDNDISRYGFDRFGELNKLGNTVSNVNGVLQQGCFEMTLYPDGTATPLILKKQDTFYAYTPMGGDKPYIAKNEEALRRFIFNETLYPLRGDDYYGAN